MIDSIGKSILASPEMTAKWEKRLQEIGEGQASPAIFMEQAKKLSMKLIDDAKSAEGQWTFSEDLLEEISHFTSKKQGRKHAKAKLGACKKCDGSIVEKGIFMGVRTIKKQNVILRFLKNTREDHFTKKYFETT